jgi:hypothetical protein
MACSNSGCSGCLNIIDIGCYGHCVSVEIPIVAASTAIYYLEYEFLGSFVSQEVVLRKGENLKINASSFNESSTIVFSVYNQSGAKLAVNQLDSLGEICTSYDSFKIKILPSVSLVNDCDLCLCV